jgi:hypothetical protein
VGWCPKSRSHKALDGVLDSGLKIDVDCQAMSNNFEPKLGVLYLQWISCYIEQGFDNSMTKSLGNEKSADLKLKHKPRPWI